MHTTPESRNREARPVHPGVYVNPQGGYTVHVKLKDRVLPILSHPVAADEWAPADTPTLAGIVVGEDCVMLVLEHSSAILLHVSDPRARHTVLRFYHANGVLWRIVPVEQLNPGWVFGHYVFWGDRQKFEAWLAHIRGRPMRPALDSRPTLWVTGGWTEAVVYTPTPLIWRVEEWQHSPLTTPQVVTPTTSESQALSSYPPDVQMLLTLQAEGIQKTTYQLGGLTLVLTYLERIGLAAVVDRYCRRDGLISEGSVMTVLVVNRLLQPCPLSGVAEWVQHTGLHLWLGIPDPTLLNYDRLVDTLKAVFPYWQTIAAEITLNAVAQFGLDIHTVHYDLTSICFCGKYEGSSWVEFGYSRDHRPDRPQLTIGLSTTADDDVVLPGGSGIHPGGTNDATTTVPTYQTLQALFERSDLLVTGDRIMQSVENMLTIARAHGRFLGPVDWTPDLRRLVARCAEEEFQELPISSARRGYPIKAAFRHLWFTHKEPLSEAAYQRLRTWRRRRHIRGPVPRERKVRFWMRAAIILDTARQVADAQQREYALQEYEVELAYTVEHLGRGRFYGDPEWVAHHLADLECRYQAVRDLLGVTFTHAAGKMELSYQRLPERIAQAARRDGKWVLVTNQPPEPGQSTVEYMDWMVGVYHNHRHIERRMRNLKRDLPIRPLYLHRDDAVVALCFASLLALTIYTLIERDVRADPVLAAEGLRTTHAVLTTLAGWGLSAFYTPSGYETFWLDTPTALQQLIVQRLHLPDPGTRVPHARRWPLEGLASASETRLHLWYASYSLRVSGHVGLSMPMGSVRIVTYFAVVKVLFVMSC